MGSSGTGVQDRHSTWYDSDRKAPKPGGKRWKARYRDTAGKEHSRCFDLRSDADRWLRAQKTARDNRTWVDPARGKVNFRDWLVEWSTSQIPLRPGTVARNDSYTTNHVLPAFGHMRLSAISHEAVCRWVASLSRKGLAPATVKKIFECLSKPMRHAHQQRLISENPCAGVPLPRVEPPAIDVVPLETVFKLCEVIDPRYELFPLVGATAGLRAGELLGLRVRDFDRERRCIKVRRTASDCKGKTIIGDPKTAASRREVPISKHLADRLAEASSGKGLDDLFFPAPMGGPWLQANFRRRIWTPAVKALGLELRIHDLRHVCVSYWIEQNTATPLEIAKWAGHTSTVTVFNRYGHLFAGQKSAAMDAMDAAIAAATGSNDRPQLVIVGGAHRSSA